MGSAHPRTIAAAVAALIVAAIVAAVAFGATSMTSSSAQVNVRETSLGKIIVDSKGHTLYLYAPDKKGKSSCYGKCATYWPPLIKTSAKLAGAGINASLITTTKRTNGKLQLVYNGHPLYGFAEDTKAGADERPGPERSRGSLVGPRAVGQADREEAGSCPEQRPRRLRSPTTTSSGGGATATAETPQVPGTSGAWHLSRRFECRRASAPRTRSPRNAPYSRRRAATAPRTRPGHRRVEPEVADELPPHAVGRRVEGIRPADTRDP